LALLRFGMEREPVRRAAPARLKASPSCDSEWSASLSGERLLRIRHRGDRIDLLERFLIFAEERFDAVELLLHRGAVVGARREVEQDRRHRLRVDGESLVA